LMIRHLSHILRTDALTFIAAFSLP
jgi:hypothetical protein